MRLRRLRVGWLGWVAGVCWATATPGLADEATPEREGRKPSAAVRPGLFPGRAALRDPKALVRLASAARVPLERVPEPLADKVRAVLERPALFARGPTEVFPGKPELYYWLLDHPDRAVLAWQRLGARCIAITERGDGVFGWADGNESDVRWQAAYKDQGLRVWYAEGVVRPGPLWPRVPVQVVIVLHHESGHDGEGRRLLRHQADVFLHTDSKTALLAAKMLGASAPRVAEQSLGQMQMFFSALVWYAAKNPEQAEVLFADGRPAPGAVDKSGTPR